MQHKDIPDGERHEPKGISTAPVGQVYVSKGDGSGEWRDLEEPVFAELFGENLTLTLTDDDTYQDLTGTTEGSSSNMSASGMNGTIHVNRSGSYLVMFNASLTISIASIETVTFRYMVNGDPSSRTLKFTAADGVVTPGSAQSIVQLSQGDIIKVQVKCDHATDVVFSHVDLTLTRIN